MKRAKYRILKDNIHEHTDFHYLSLVEVVYDKETGEVVNYFYITELKDINYVCLLEMVQGFVEAFENPILIKSHILKNVLNHRIDNLK